MYIMCSGEIYLITGMSPITYNDTILKEITVNIIK
jgi:hypothetical protein